MSRQEQNDRHIIWSDISLDLDDWRESLEELYPGYSDDELYDIMVKSNAENIYDERVNLKFSFHSRLSLSATSADGTAECRVTR